LQPQSCEAISGDLLAQSQLSIRLAERNGAFELASRVENTNFTGAEARAALGILDCLTLLWKHRLNAWSFESFPAPSGLDFAGMAEHYYLVCNSLVNELHQNLVLERFCKEAKSSRIECGLAHYWIVLSANKNNPRLR
jgi:hypothetical protein